MRHQWDLQKTLRLLHKSNPTLFEWFSSPIVYQKTEFADEFRDLMMHYFSSKKTLYHYVSMAEGNYTIPLKENEAGVALVSGFNPAVYNMVLSNELDPYKCLLAQINSERYAAIEEAFMVHIMFWQGEKRIGIGI